MDPPNGAFVCSSDTFVKGSVCALQCDYGYASVKESVTRCLGKSGQETWDEDVERSFECKRAIG